MNSIDLWTGMWIAGAVGAATVFILFVLGVRSALEIDDEDAF